MSGSPIKFDSKTKVFSNELPGLVYCVVEPMCHITMLDIH